MRQGLIPALAVVWLGGSSHASSIGRNEAAAMAYLRTLLAAERAYAMANSGLFDEPRCLAVPRACLRYPGEMPGPFLDASTSALMPGHGYRFAFHPGPPVPPEARPAAASTSGVDRFAITAVPLRPGVTGGRRFCLDQGGFVHESDGVPPVTAEEGCARMPRLAEDRSSSPAEADARIVADLRVIVSAQSAYASANSGLFDQLRCLAAPARCIPRWLGQPASFLDPAFAALPPRHGYRLRFHPGPSAAAQYGPAASPTSMLRFAVTAVPLRPGTFARRRLCLDQDGLIREPEGPRLVAREGGCERRGAILDDPPASSREEIEARVLSELRNIVSAEQAYASANAGLYDRLDCLLEPTSCIPRYPSEGPAFLVDPRLVSLRERHGYRRRFHPGRPPLERPVSSSPTSLTGYAYTAVPAVRGPGARSFCVDPRGDLCQTPDGREPSVVDAQCEPCDRVYY